MTIVKKECSCGFPRKIRVFRISTMGVKTNVDVKVGFRTKYPNKKIRGVEDMEGNRVSRGNKVCGVTAGESQGVVRGKTGFFWKCAEMRKSRWLESSVLMDLTARLFLQVLTKELDFYEMQSGKG